MTRHWRSLTALLLLALTLAACTGDSKSELVGKWQATITHKPSGNAVKVLWEFLPDGTFTAAPMEDPGTFVDKDKYEIINDGATIKLRSQLLEGGSTCEVNRSTMTGETEGSVLKFTKL
ncbi:MAG: hypothetical protein ABI596_01940 [Pyrinomonadaceae bacterium]